MSSLGKKINEFDLSDGKVKTFNKIFKATPLPFDEDKDVEILDFVDSGNVFTMSVFKRLLDISGEIVEHDFGMENYVDNGKLIITEGVDYILKARNLNGKIVATAYSWEELAKKLDENVGLLKKRFYDPITKESNSKLRVNIEREDL